MKEYRKLTWNQRLRRSNEAIREESEVVVPQFSVRATIDTERKEAEVRINRGYDIVVSFDAAPDVAKHVVESVVNFFLGNVPSTCHRRVSTVYTEQVPGTMNDVKIVVHGVGPNPRVWTHIDVNEHAMGDIFFFNTPCTCCIESEWRNETKMSDTIRELTFIFHLFRAFLPNT
jgi:hypothetical protein